MDVKSWEAGMERAAELIDEEAASAQAFINESAAGTDTTRLYFVRDAMDRMAETIRAFKAAGPAMNGVEETPLSARGVSVGEAQKETVPAPASCSPRAPAPEAGGCWDGDQPSADTPLRAGGDFKPARLCLNPPHCTERGECRARPECNREGGE